MSNQRFKDEALDWRERVISTQKDIADTLEVLVLTGVQKPDEYHKVLASIERLKCIEYDDYGFLNFVREVLQVSGKTLDNYPTMKVMYEQEYKNFMDEGEWVPFVVDEVASYLIEEVNAGRFDVVELDNEDQTRGYAITCFDILANLRKHHIYEEVGLVKQSGLRETVCVKILSDLVKKALMCNYNVGMISVKTGPNNITSESFGDPVCELFGKYRIKVTGDVKIFLTRDQLSLPDVYLPIDNIIRQEFLECYRRVGFNNKFYTKRPKENKIKERSTEENVLHRLGDMVSINGKTIANMVNSKGNNKKD